MPSGICNACQTYSVDPRYAHMGFCRSCAMCNWCGSRPRKQKADGTFSARCDMCMCQDCGSVDGYQEYENPEEPMMRPYWRLCGNCYRKKVAHLMCKRCKRELASVMKRGEKKPTLCQACMFFRLPDGQKATHYCFFCTNKATHIAGKWVVCKKHAETRTCATDGCTPGTQCHRCQTRQREDERIAGLRSAMTPLTDYNHEQNDKGECYSDCRACMDISRADIFFGNTGPKFWPDKDGPNPDLKMAERRHNKSNRYIACEIEVAGLHNPKRKDLLIQTIKKWGGQIVHDGSLPGGGFEINMAPAAGDYFVRQAQEIGDALRDAEAYTTAACGLHVHADARDFTYADMRRLFLYYSKIEPVLIQMQPYSRSMNSTYCQPVGQMLAEGVKNFALPPFYKKIKGKAKPYKQAVMNSVYLMERRKGGDFSGNVPRPERTSHYGSSHVHYHGMNVHSWFFRGTVENRFHGGTTVARKIVDWATLWAAVLDKAMKISDKDIEAITDPRAEILSIAPTKRAAAYVEARLAAYKDEYVRRRIAV
jgi:hypothetical protein